MCSKHPSPPIGASSNPRMRSTSSSKAGESSSSSRPSSPRGTSRTFARSCASATSTASRSFACKTTSSPNGAMRRGISRSGRQRRLTAEFTRSAKGLAFTKLPDPDTYAPEIGFVSGFPAARDRADGTAWLTHCYGMVGVGRDTDADSAGGTELYVVIGHAPRQLDRNITVVGRVVHGMEHLSSLPRGTGALGFYEKAEQHVPIRQIRLASEVPASERTPLELLRTDTPTFEALVESRRNRRDEWYKVPAGRIDVCSVPLPVRARD